METAEAVQDRGPADPTPLKQGVNEICVNTWFGSPARLSKKRDPPFFLTEASAILLFAWWRGLVVPDLSQ